tara:strand:+ start:589 stop:1305 length:717 start_codon:yes stop_codon:yes gene_type:complete
MRKSIFFTLVLISFHASSQSLTLVPHESNVNVNNSTSLLGDLGTDIAVKNISSNTINVGVSRNVISSTGGTINYFCWQACYGSLTDISPVAHASSFSPGHEELTKFQVHFDNQSIAPAFAIIKYCAFNVDDITDSTCVTVNYSVDPTSEIDEEEINLFNDFYPNPTSTFSYLNYSILPTKAAEVIVTDILGTVVKNKIIQNSEGIVRLDMSNTPNGLYFANIYVDGKLDAIKRLLVRK